MKTVSPILLTFHDNSYKFIIFPSDRLSRKAMNKRIVIVGRIVCFWRILHLETVMLF